MQGQTCHRTSGECPTSLETSCGTLSRELRRHVSMCQHAAKLAWALGPEGCKEELSCQDGFELSAPISVCGATACDQLGSSYISSDRAAYMVTTWLLG